MRIEKTTKYKKKISFIDYLQYFLSIAVGTLFLIGFIPFAFAGVFKFIIILIFIQIFISLFRLRIINVILELILIGLATFSLIPILGYFFRFFGFIVSILEISTFKNYKLYKKIEIKKFYPKDIKEKLIRKKKIYKDAEFKER